MAMNTPVHPGAIVREDCPEAIGPVGHRRRKAARHRAPDAFQSRQREGVGFDRDGLSSIEGIRLHPRNVARHADGLRSCAISSFGKRDQCRTNCCRVGSSHRPLAVQGLMSREFTSSVDGLRVLLPVLNQAGHGLDRAGVAEPTTACAALNHHPLFSLCHGIGSPRPRSGTCVRRNQSSRS